MKTLILLLTFALCTSAAESIFTDEPSNSAITLPFDADSPGMKSLETDSYRIRSFIDSESHVTVKIMINRNGDDNVQVKTLLEATKNALRDAGLLIDPFPLPDGDSSLGSCFSALNGDLHQITYLNSRNNNIINIVISGRDLTSVNTVNLWLREHNK